MFAFDFFSWLTLRKNLYCVILSYYAASLRNFSAKVLIKALIFY